MERGGDCDCCFCLSPGGADATLDCGLRRWPKVLFWEIANFMSSARGIPPGSAARSKPISTGLIYHRYSKTSIPIYGDAQGHPTSPLPSPQGRSAHAAGAVQAAE